MTPERLAEIESLIENTGWRRFDFRDLSDEVRRLRAERDARLLAGQPVSEERLGEIRGNLSLAGELDRTEGGELFQHVAFLERLLADADDLPQVRRTGYADGWRAAMSKAKEMAKKVAWPEDVRALERYLEELAERGPE